VEDSQENEPNNNEIQTPSPTIHEKKETPKKNASPQKIQNEEFLKTGENTTVTQKISFDFYQLKSQLVAETEAKKKLLQEKSKLETLVKKLKEENLNLKEMTKDNKALKIKGELEAKIEEQQKLIEKYRQSENKVKQLQDTFEAEKTKYLNTIKEHDKTIGQLKEKISGWSKKKESFREFVLKKTEEVEKLNEEITLLKSNIGFAPTKKEEIPEEELEETPRPPELILPKKNRDTKNELKKSKKSEEKSSKKKHSPKSPENKAIAQETNSSPRNSKGEKSSAYLNLVLFSVIAGILYLIIFGSTAYFTNIRNLLEK